MGFPGHVRIVEVGPRDGLQDECRVESSLDTKILFVNLLSATGLKNIEIGSFVSPKHVPGMKDTALLIERIDKNPDVTYSALVPNMKGLETALTTRIDEVVIFASASESFAVKNINATIPESLERFRLVVKKAIENKLKVRGDIACTLGCPYEGHINPDNVAKIALELLGMGCYEICLADTTGTGTPSSIKILLERVSTVIPIEKIAVHLHDTTGLGMDTLLAALEFGVSVVDSSVAGLGGCPYAETAGGNIPTEDVVSMLRRLNIDAGIDLGKIIDAGIFISDALGIPNHANVKQVE